ncbi:MAG: sensor histidine kinase [Burkholderiales bacterium]|nr:sensor histidine kinase [Burkholderiales bacterium]
MKSTDDNQVLAFVQEVCRTSKVIWWQFFDWLAVISWRYLAGVSLLAMILGGMLGLGALMPFVVFSSILIKSLAGGKHKAELAASAAATRADVEALERRLLEAEVAALQAQIEPHFLFNTLALISQLIETNPARAALVHADLIKYLRAALPQIRQQGTGKLGQQMELSRAYLSIMQARMQDRLTYHLDLPAELAQAECPSMMIQTLVENAIKHGLEPKIEGGHIAVVARQVGNELQLAVSDNGVGFNLNADEGVGLTNIRERLKVLYGAKARIIIEAPPEGGARLCLQLPLK